MSCGDGRNSNPVNAINKWVSAINFVVGRVNPAAGAVTGQFAIASQSAASAVALANGDGTAATAIPGVSISAPTLAYFAKVSSWISVMAKAAGVVVPGVGLVSLGMTVISAAAAAASNKTFNEIVTDPSFWNAIGSGSPNSYLQSKYGLSIDDLMNSLWEALLTGEMKSLRTCPSGFNGAKKWTPPRDPIILDLNGNGFETIGLSSNIYFDHDGDGILTKTGWVGKNDALLVWDRNINGSIDTGAELFGDFTPLPNGALAPNGFAALAALDANGDGVLDASDPFFAELKLWRDASQDGETGAGELISLADAGIVSLNLANVLKNQGLSNGNTLSREGSFTRADGSTAAMGEFKLATDTFDTQFANAIEVPEALRSLPSMSGSGNVRELQQAAAQSGELAGLLSQFQGAGTRAAQKVLLDQLLTRWADTSGMAASMEERAAGKYRIQYDAFGNVRRSDNIYKPVTATGGDTLPSVSGGMTDLAGNRVNDQYKALIAEWSRKLHVLEAFNGQYFFNLPEKKSQTEGANFGLTIDAARSSSTNTGSAAAMIEASFPTLKIQFSQAQLDLLQQSYDALVESVYSSLVIQTRLKPYLDSLELVFDETGLRLDASALNQMLAQKQAADPENALADLLDLDRYAQRYLSSTNWDGLARFDQWVDTLPASTSIQALLAEFKVRRLTAGDDTSWLTDKADIVLAGDGKDTLYGYNSNDRLFGQGGDDRIYAGDGDDLISGGAGNDQLFGGAGADMYVFGLGYGHDTIRDYAENGVQRDTVRLVGLNPADIEVRADHDDNLTFSIRSSGETLSVPRNGSWWGKNGVGQYVFEDGTVWSHDDALRATVLPATEGDDVIHGSSASDTITGQAGDDTLVGNAGDDLIDGGAGNDLLIGSTGWNWIYENGSYRAERRTTSSVSANGNDTYLFGRGDGQDTVIDGDSTSGNIDTLRFKEGVAVADLRFTRNGSDLVIGILNSDDQVTLKQYFDASWGAADTTYLIERIAFADGTALSFADVQRILFAGSERAETIVGSGADDVLTGQDGDDVLLGGAGHDVLDGGAGNDVLRGGGVRDYYGSFYDGAGAADTYRFGRGDGQDSIIEDSWLQDETDRIEFKTGVAPSDVRLERVRGSNGWQVSDDLKITIRDTGETLTVKNHFNESNRHAVEEIVFSDGVVWDADKIKSLVLLGEAEGETLLGFAERNDEIIGAGGNDALYGMSGNDSMYGGEGDDLLDAGAGSDVLAGGEGRDILFGRDGDDVLDGGDGVDQLYGNEGNDTLNGGAGNDVLDGGAGADTYRFGRGSGRDVAEENASREMAGNLVVLDAGISAADVVVRKSGNDLVLKLADTTDELVLRGAATYLSGSSFSGVRFADGTEWDYATLQARALIGTAGDDRIEGFDAQSEVISGGAGNDTLMGGVGADVYLFGRGDGQDLIFDRDASAGSVDTLRFGAGVLASDVVLVRDGRDLVARISDTGESITIKGFYQWEPGGWRQRIERMEFDDGSVWLTADMESRATLAPQDNRLIGSAGPDVLTGNELGNLVEGLDGVDVLEGGAGNDTLVGGLDSDTLRGGDGDDVLYGLLQESSGDEDASVLTPTAQYYLNEADNALIDGLSEAQPGFGEQYLGRNDDGSTGAIDITSVFGAQGLNFFGQSHTRIYINNNGNITFNGSLSSYTPSQIGSGSAPIIAPFWADVDTRAGAAATTPGGNSEGSNLLYYDLDAENGVLTVTWDDVGYYNNRIDKANAFQLQLVNRGGGDFDIIFRYEAVNWTTGDASGGSGGLGGTPVRAGYSAGDGIAAHYFEMPESGNQAAMLNLDETAGNTGRTGVHVFHVRNGRPVVDNGSLIQQGDRGINFLFGGAGNDTYIVDTAGDVVTEYVDEGIDSVQSSVDFVLSDNVENLSLTGSRTISGSGNALNNTLVGNSGANILRGLEGDDALDGGAGVDTLYGGQGADTLRAGTQGGQLFGEEGGDTYIYFAGDGEVLIDDAPQTGGQGGLTPNVLVFGEGIRLEDVRFEESAGDLLITFVGQPEDRVILRGYSSQRATQTNSVDIIRFADGREIVGLGVADSSGGGTLDVLANGAPAVGGTGSDVYRIALDGNASGSEFVIVETGRPGDENRIELSGAINLDDLHLSFDGRDLLLQIPETGQVIRFAGFDPRNPGMQAPVSVVTLGASGLSITFEDLLARGIRIIGTPEVDLLAGTALSDWIEGRESDDTLSGGLGGDRYIIDATAGSDTIIDSESGGAPNTLVLPAGTTLNDVRLSHDNEGFLILDLISTGNRIRLSGFDPQDPLGSHAVERFRFGSDGEEISYAELLSRGFDIVGTDQNDALVGTSLADRIRGGEGNDLIEGTSGGDWLSGEGGNDSYVVNLGDGAVTIEDVAAENAGNVLRFGAGIEPAALRNSLRFEEDGNGGHVLLIPYGAAGDVVRLSGFNPEDVLGAHAIERFEFADGTAVDYSTLVSWTFVVEGDTSGNALSGTNVGDRLYGYDGDDVMASGDGEDVLTGGAGDDLLRGGAGRDAYVVNRGDGQDTIDDDVIDGVGNVLTFGEGIRREDVRVEVDGDDLLVRYGSNGDFVRVTGDAASLEGGVSVIDTFEFADGTTVTLREFLNQAPTVSTAVQDQVLLEDAGFRLQLPADLFVDPDGGNVLAQVMVSGLAQTPDWLRYDSETRTLYGTPDNNDLGEFDIVIQGVDAQGASSLHSFHVTVQNTNDAPELASSLGDQQVVENSPFSIALPVDAFTDVDAGDQLAFVARLEDGSQLPEWLVFDSENLSFSGTPGDAAVGNISVRVTATDRDGASVSDVFVITVNVDPDVEAGQTLIGDWQDNRLIGGAEDDVAYGNGASDYISLFGGNNTAYGSYGNDTILAGGGNDTLYGNGGNDLIEAGEGQNRVYADWGDDTVSTGAGDDIIDAGGGRNRVSAGAGNDRITTLWGDDWIDAGTGNNVISAGVGNNYIVAGAGDDTITTETGDDIIHAGDGDNIVSASEGFNQIFTGAGRDVIQAFGVNSIQSGDGSDDITLGWGADTIDAGAGDDVIRAGGGGDTVRGGAGNDIILATQWSNDTYVFGRHDGQDIISDDGGSDSLLFEEVNSDQLWFERVGSDLQINVLGQQDCVTVQGWYSKPFGTLEQIKTADGKVLLDSQVDALVDAMAAFAPPAAGQTSLPSSYQASLDPVIAASWK